MSNCDSFEASRDYLLNTASSAGLILQNSSAAVAAVVAAVVVAVVAAAADKAIDFEAAESSSGGLGIGSTGSEEVVAVDAKSFGYHQVVYSGAGLGSAFGFVAERIG